LVSSTKAGAILRQPDFMADFRTHITTSTVLGVAYGTAAYVGFDLPWEHCALAAGLCSLAGMLPDLDSDFAVPFREMICLVSAVVPIMLVPRMRAAGVAPEMMILIAAGVYFLLRFGAGGLFRRYTKHRGMFHSIPAAAVAGMLTFLLVFSSDIEIRMFKAWAVVTGFMSHLVLDEIYAIDLRGRRVKKSFGSAIKFFGPSLWGNISVYAKVILLGVLIAADPATMAHYGREPLQISVPARQWALEWLTPDDEVERR
jgi:membrane-bound metal-dependent hydrolase YbcI (DUF457 family)